MAAVNAGPRLALNAAGVWEIRWSESRRSRRKSTQHTDRTAAELVLAKFLQDRATFHSRLHGKPLTVGAALGDYLREHVDAGPVVAKIRQHQIAANLRSFFGIMACRNVDAACVLQYQKQRRSGAVGTRRARSDGTLRRELNMLIAAINHAARARRIAPTDRPHIPLPASPGSRDFWLSEDEARQLLEACDINPHRGTLFVRIALATAARRRSIETLTWGQVDLVARRIQYNPPGRRQTAKRRVAVPISDALLPHLLAARAGADSFLVLCNDKVITNDLAKVCRAAYKATGNARFLDVRPHTLRHTWATLAARAGVSMFEIAGVLGDSLATVQKNYLHHSPEHLRDAVNFMG